MICGSQICPSLDFVTSVSSPESSASMSLYFAMSPDMQKLQQSRHCSQPFENDAFAVNCTQTMPQARCKVLNKIIATIPDKKITWQPTKSIEMQWKPTGSLRKSFQTFLYSTNDKLFTAPSLTLECSCWFFHCPPQRCLTKGQGQSSGSSRWKTSCEVDLQKQGVKLSLSPSSLLCDLLLLPSLKDQFIPASQTPALDKWCLVPHHSC